MHQSILFDLDGTLTDPFDGITNAVAYALSHYGISVTDGREELKPFIGPPLTDSFMQYYHFSEKDAHDAIRIYREYFSEKGIFENRLYPGVDNMLNDLKSCGKQIILATSKPQVFAERILNHFGIAPYFDRICGSLLDHTRVKKSEVIAYALSLIDERQLSSAVMVGDRSFDIIGGKENHLTTIGVLYGYGTEEELENAHADYLVDSVGSLHTLLKSE